MGQVERFADITPDKVSLEGETGDQIQATVTIVPKANQPFKIVSSRAKDGQNIRFELKEDTSGGSSAYRLTVTNLKSEPARYRDTIYLNTDNELNPVIKIKVYGTIDKPRVATVIPGQLIIRGHSGDKRQVSSRIVPKDGRELKITEAKADKGEHISFKLSEAKEGETTVYTVTVESQKVIRGLYRDVIRLKTTSEIEPEIEIPVMVMIN